MGRPVDKFKLPTGMGALLRYAANGPWTWQRYDRQRKKNTCTPTHQINRSKAEQFVYQEIAKRDSQKCRLQGATILFASVADEYGAAREQGRYRSKLRGASLQKLRAAIKAFEALVGAGYQSLQIDKIDGAMLTEFVQREAQRISPDAANRNVDYIRGILGYAFAKHYIMHDPSSSVERAIAIPTDEDDDQGVVGWPCPTAQEVRQILAATKPIQRATGKRAFNGSELGRRVCTGINTNDYTDLLAALCLTGLRIGEACFLIWNDVDLTNRIIHIRPGHKNRRFWQPKTKFSIRRVAIIPDLELILRRLRRTNRNQAWVFETRRGTQLHPHNVSKRFRQICEGLGFQKHYVVHSLRKYWASTVAQQGMDWKVMIKMFGHSDFKLILSTYYAQNDDVRLVEEASKIDFGLALPKTA